MTARRLKFDIRRAGRPILIVLGAWVVLALGFYMFFVRDKVEEYRSLKGGNEPKLQALREHTEDVETREGFLAAVEQAEVDLRRLRDEMLSTRERRMVEVQNEIEALCTQFRINFASVNFDNEILSDEELDRMVMVVPLEGSYANLRNFLQAVESSDEFLVVERVGLAEGKEGGVLLQLNITIATYFDLPEELRENKRRVTRRRGGGSA